MPSVFTLEGSRPRKRKGGKRYYLRRVSRDCEQIMKRTKTYGGADYAIGRVCRAEGGWKWGSTGRTMYGPVKTKTLAMRKAITGWLSWVGVRYPGDY